MNYKILLQETKEFYQVNPRSASLRGICVYNSVENKTKCAIGRLCSNIGFKEGSDFFYKDNIKFLINNHNPKYTSVIEPLKNLTDYELTAFYIDKKITSLNFFCQLQSLHDSVSNWTKDSTLSQEGEKQYNSLMELATTLDKQYGI